MKDKLVTDCSILSVDGCLQLIRMVVNSAIWLLMPICLVACGDNQKSQQSTVTSIVMTEPETTGYAFGSLNGVKMKIPSEYQFFGVQYNGENAFDKTTWRKDLATIDTPITTFSILLRATNFEPRRTQQDQKDWIADGHYIGPETRWFSVGVYPNLKSDTTPQQRVSEWRTRIIESWKTKASKFDSKTAKELYYGLQLDEPVLRPGSIRPLSPEVFIYSTGHDSQLQTLITCQPPGNVPKPLWFCHQGFDVKGAKAGVDVQYQIDQLPRWQEIQTRISAIINSFVVQDKRIDSTVSLPMAASSSNTNQ